MDLVSLNLLFLENRRFTKGALVKALSTGPGGSTRNVHTEIGTELEQPLISRVEPTCSKHCYGAHCIRVG
jgi:hypothetical protein